MWTTIMRMSDVYGVDTKIRCACSIWKRHSKSAFNAVHQSGLHFERCEVEAFTYDVNCVEYASYCLTVDNLNDWTKTTQTGKQNNADIIYFDWKSKENI